MSQPRAVIYVRVSSEEQIHNFSLATQEKYCRDFCDRSGWEVDTVFTDAGESAKTIHRPELQRMVEYCRKSKGLISIVVVYNLSRFARNAADHQSVRAILAKVGVRLRSVTEPIDDSSSGKLMENIVSAIAQFDNDVRSDRTIAGMAAAAEQGRWTHKAPIGLRFEGSRSSSRLVRDEARAPFITRAFELFATGVHSATEVLAMLTREGLRTTRGTIVSSQTFNALLRNDIYAGWIVNRRRGSRHRGAFPTLVQQATFDAVQLLLARSRTGSTRKRNNPDFPLKGTVLCGYCQRSLTASKSTGRNAGRYAYYSCWRKGCEKVKVRSEILESDFLRFLASLQPRKPYVRLFREVVLDRWKQAEANVSKELLATEKRIGTLEEKRLKMLDLLTDGRIAQEHFDAGIAKLEDDLRFARIARRDLQVESIDVEAILDYGESLLLNVASMWTEATFEQKQRIQRVLLPSGAPYADGAFGNAEIVSVFRYLRELESSEVSLVAHTGFEPVLPP
jgi:site-specific DNA recombinase